MVIASDYSGQHKGATHEAYSFLVTVDNALEAWLPLLDGFRRSWLPDNRRISFKKLNEPVRWRALPSFLDVTSKLRANVITILVDRRIGSFVAGGPDAIRRSLPDCFPEESSPGTVEKMLRLASLLALILSGLRRESQVSRWISDHDEALDTNAKREQFARLATYINVGLTGWRQAADNWFGTTEAHDLPVWAEDLAAVPDLVAGAYCQLSPHLPTILGKETWRILASADNVNDRRVVAVANWLAGGKQAMKHVLLRLEQDDRGEVRSSAQAFLTAVRSR